MSVVRWRRIAFAVACTFGGFSGPAPGAVGAESPPPAESPWRIWSEVSPIAVLLFSNYTGTSQAIETVMPLVYRELDLRGARYRSHAELRPVLRQNRIRSLGGLTEEDARILQRETGAGLLVLGTIEIFETDEILEVGISARLVAIDEMKIIAAASAAATNEEFAGLFGIGKMTEPAELAERVVEQLFDGLERFLAPVSGPRPRPARVAVVPFDDFSERGFAGDIVAGILTTALVSRGYDVVESGVMRGVALEHRSVLRGGVGHPMLDLLHELGADFVVTGEVAEFRPARGAADFAVPTLDFGARLVDVRERRLVLTFDRTRNGRDGEFMLEIGRVFSVGRLARRELEELAREIEHQVPHDFARDTYEGRIP